jgi:hypothetical protein
VVLYNASAGNPNTSANTASPTLPPGTRTRHRGHQRSSPAP